MITVANFCSHLSVANICSPKVGIAKGKGKAPAVGKAKGKAKGEAEG
jgi:hypothetical protein